MDRGYVVTRAKLNHGCHGHKSRRQVEVFDFARLHVLHLARQFLTVEQAHAKAPA
jgi:hypothetical protein